MKIERPSLNNPIDTSYIKRKKRFLGVRIDSVFHKKVSIFAKEQDITMTELITLALSKYTNIEI
jgi:predicted HicB family RNase H-like nuclease